MFLLLSQYVVLVLTFLFVTQTPLDAPYRSGSIPYCKGRRVLRVQRQLYQLHVPRIRFHVGTTDPCLESFGRGSKGGEGPLRLFDPFSRGTVTSWLDFGEVIEMCKSVRESRNSTHMFKRNYV
ncbi:hypothetical protein HDV57DRAFT_113925 [Trichoderma longibrachiatum]